jgi:hypothetical protein
MRLVSIFKQTNCVIGCQKVYDFRTSTGHLQKKIRKIDESRDSKYFPYSTKLETRVPAGKGQFGTLGQLVAREETNM